MDQTINELTNPFDDSTQDEVDSIQDEYERLDDFEFEDNDAELQENTVFTGTISDCHGFRVDGGEMKIKLAITLDDGTDYDSQCLYKYSPLRYLVKNAERQLNRKIKPADLIGMRVEFTVKYNRGYWNLKTIRTI